MLTIIKNYPKLRAFYLMALVNELYFIVPIWLFFYLRIINFEQAAMLTVIQAITSVILEIPTGAFADIFGKRITLIIAFIIWGLSNFFYIFADSFQYFIVLEIIKGIGKSMYSGSWEALIYDTLKADNMESKYKEVVSDFTTLGWTGLFISTYAGGFLYNISVNLPYILTAISMLVVSLILLIKIKEPRIDSEKFELSIRTYLKQNIIGFKELFSTYQVGLISTLIIMITFVYFLAAEFLGISQLKDYELDPTKVGLFWGTAYVFSAIVSQTYKRLPTYFSFTFLLASCTAILFASYILAEFVGLYLGLLLIFLRITTSTIFINLKSHLLNSYISSRNRATALSTMSLLVVLPYSLILIFFGDLIDKTSPNYFAFLVGIVCVVPVIIIFSLLIVRKNKLLSYEDLEVKL